jgi:hypothetical protein
MHGGGDLADRRKRIHCAVARRRDRLGIRGERGRPDGEVARMPHIPMRIGRRPLVHQPPCRGVQRAGDRFWWLDHDFGRGGDRERLMPMRHAEGVDGIAEVIVIAVRPRSRVDTNVIAKTGLTFAARRLHPKFHMTFRHGRVVVEARDVCDEISLACCCHTGTTDQTGR